MRTTLAVTFIVTLGFGAGADAQPLTLSSPAGKVAMTVDVVDSRVRYTVAFGGREVVRPSALGLGLEGGARLDSDLQVVHVTRGESR